MPAGQLILGTGMIGLTVVIHIGGILCTVAWLRAHFKTQTGHNSFGWAVRMFVASVLGVFLFHTVEIWLWAALYMLLGEFSDLERALYFSTVTFTTLGYGDITLSPRWQMLSGLEAANGIILFGVSTAFIFAVLRYLFEAAGIVGRHRE
ncbi:MAG: potassium channel family protein [Hyphomicrobiaceae bacterium]|nr:potassium channel family protein [Hyphomicrobiaceae bacterium]